MGQLKVECHLPEGGKAYISSWTSPFVGERVMISEREVRNGRSISVPKRFRVTRVIYEECGPEAGGSLLAIVSVKPEHHNSYGETA